MDIRTGHSDLSDEEVIESFKKKGDLKWMAVLYKRYAELTYGVCLKYFKNPTLARDASMNIFEKLPGKLIKHQVEKFKPWLYTVCRNHCLEQLRKENRNISKELNAGIMYSEQLFHPDDVDKEEKLNILEKCIGQLPLSQKKCITMFYLESRTYQFVSESMDLTWNQVRSFIQNGRRNLKNCMEKHGKA